MASVSMDLKDYKDFRKTLNYIARWGIKAQKFFGENTDGLARAPSSRHGICWSERSIYWQLPKDYKEGYESCGLVHELSHVLVQQQASKIDEIHSPLLALDYYGVRYMRISGWKEWMENYLDLKVYWPQYNTRTRGSLIRTSLHMAVQCGLLTPNGKPTFQRTGFWSKNGFIRLKVGL